MLTVDAILESKRRLDAILGPATPRIRESSFVPAFVPVLQLHPDFEWCSDEFRAQMNAWLLQRFGTQMVAWHVGGEIHCAPLVYRALRDAFPTTPEAPRGSD